MWNQKRAKKWKILVKKFFLKLFLKNSLLNQDIIDQKLPNFCGLK